MQIEAKNSHCWPIILWLRKMKSITPMKGELENIPLEDLVSIVTAEPSLVDDSIPIAKWFVKVLAVLNTDVLQTLPGDALPLTRDGKLDNVHYHLPVSYTHLTLPTILLV